jgi:hypothetical protein
MNGLPAKGKAPGWHDRRKDSFIFAAGAAHGAVLAQGTARAT